MRFWPCFLAITIHLTAYTQSFEQTRDSETLIERVEQTIQEIEDWKHGGSRFLDGNKSSATIIILMGLGFLTPPAYIAGLGLWFGRAAYSLRRTSLGKKLENTQIFLEGIRLCIDERVQTQSCEYSERYVRTHMLLSRKGKFAFRDLMEHTSLMQITEKLQQDQALLEQKFKKLRIKDFN